MEIKADVLRSLKPSELNTPRDSSSNPDEEINISIDTPPKQEALKEDLFDDSFSAKKVGSVASETRYFDIVDGEISRKIAYTVSGDMDAQNILLCLPGLLETKATFLILHAYFLKFQNCKVISIDFSGRGDSDHIDGVGVYKMSLYLSDISQLIRGVILNNKAVQPRLSILGTSMGGVLAMYLTQIFGKKIYEIILNDIALTVNWTSLYALYKSMKHELGFQEVRNLAQELRVDERAISDVQLPGHFDLSYRADIWGMNFHEALEGYKGKVALIYGDKSKICTPQRVQEAQSIIPSLSVLEVKGAGHPAPFNLLVCDFIQAEMGV